MCVKKSWRVTHAVNRPYFDTAEAGLKKRSVQRFLGCANIRTLERTSHAPRELIRFRGIFGECVSKVKFGDEGGSPFETRLEYAQVCAKTDPDCSAEGVCELCGELGEFVLLVPGP